MAERAGSVAGHRRRLRERFLRAGLVGLQDYEALELLLMFAIPRRDVKPLAKLLLERYGSVEKVLDARLLPNCLKSTASGRTPPR